VLSSLTGVDTITDFVSGTDKISISQAVLVIGDGDVTVESAETRGAAGGFSADAEAVVFTANAGGTTAAAAATAIGSATGNYARPAGAVRGRQRRQRLPLPVQVERHRRRRLGGGLTRSPS
jgi:hypothetical protein